MKNVETCVNATPAHRREDKRFQAKSKEPAEKAAIIKTEVKRFDGYTKHWPLQFFAWS